MTSLIYKTLITYIFYIYAIIYVISQISRFLLKTDMWNILVSILIYTYHSFSQWMSTQIWVWKVMFTKMFDSIILLKNNIKCLDCQLTYRLTEERSCNVTHLHPDDLAFQRSRVDKLGTKDGDLSACALFQRAHWTILDCDNHRWLRCRDWAVVSAESTVTRTYTCKLWKLFKLKKKHKANLFVAY